ncbi:MAG TPA: hypothetical protein VFW09_04040 [Solirubrobacteraceae bacterium]|nr:hypothetical protein [Solirubrobacteraceae bacterium]
MDAVLRDIVETFESGLGPLADPGVIELARELPVALAGGEELHVLMQGRRRAGVRARFVLITVVGDELALAAPGSRRAVWPASGCSVSTEEVKLGGVRLMLATPTARVAIQRAMPADEAPRLAAALAPGGLSGRTDAQFSARPPVARLGASATLYDDRIAFESAPTRPLVPGVVARALELPRTGSAMPSLNRLVFRSQGKPRHVLVDGPGWSQVAAAPESAPELADRFADAVNRWVVAATA